MLGVADAELLFAALDAVAGARCARGAAGSRAAERVRRDAGPFLRDLEAHARELLVVQMLGEVPRELRLTPERDERLSPGRSAWTAGRHAAARPARRRPGGDEERRRRAHPARARAGQGGRARRSMRPRGRCWRGSSGWRRQLAGGAPRVAPPAKSARARAPSAGAPAAAARRARRAAAAPRRERPPARAAAAPCAEPAAPPASSTSARRAVAGGDGDDPQRERRCWPPRWSRAAGEAPAARLVIALPRLGRVLQAPGREGRAPRSAGARPSARSAASASPALRVARRRRAPRTGRSSRDEELVERFKDEFDAEEI